MKYGEAPQTGRYVDVDFFQANRGVLFKVVWTASTWISVVLLSPLILASRMSNVVFKACSEFLSLFPSIFGFVIRYAFYRFALPKCGDNVIIDFGTVFYQRDIAIGSNVTFGIGATIQHCELGDHVMIGDGCRLICGTRKHAYDRTDIPISEQGGQIKKIRIGSDTWIDAGSVVMNDVGEGSVIRAGSVVREPIPPGSICEGNPAVIIGTRFEHGSHGAAPVK